MGNQGESKVGSTEGLEKLMMSNSRFTSIIAEVFRVKAPVTRCSPHSAGREGFPHPVPRFQPF